MRPGFEITRLAYSGSQFYVGRRVLINPALIGSHLGWGTIAVYPEQNRLCRILDIGT